MMSVDIDTQTDTAPPKIDLDFAVGKEEIIPAQFPFQNLLNHILNIRKTTNNQKDDDIPNADWDNIIRNLELNFDNFYLILQTGLREGIKNLGKNSVLPLEIANDIDANHRGIKLLQLNPPYGNISTETGKMELKALIDSLDLFIPKIAQKVNYDRLVTQIKEDFARLHTTNVFYELFSQKPGIENNFYFTAEQTKDRLLAFTVFINPPALAESYEFLSKSPPVNEVSKPE